jgi:hypothetical protein
MTRHAATMRQSVVATIFLCGLLYENAAATTTFSKTKKSDLRYYELQIISIHILPFHNRI